MEIREIRFFRDSIPRIDVTRLSYSSSLDPIFHPRCFAVGLAECTRSEILPALPLSTRVSVEWGRSCTLPPPSSWDTMRASWLLAYEECSTKRRYRNQASVNEQLEKNYWEISRKFKRKARKISSQFSLSRSIVRLPLGPVRKQQKEEDRECIWSRSSIRNPGEKEREGEQSYIFNSIDLFSREFLPRKKIPFSSTCVFSLFQLRWAWVTPELKTIVEVKMLALRNS